MVSIENGGRTDVGCIGAGIGLGQGKRGGPLAGSDPRQIPSFLLLGSVIDHPHGSDPVAGPDPGTVAGVRLGELLIHEHLLDGRQPEPSVFFGNRHAEQTQFSDVGDNFRRYFFFFFHLKGQGIEDVFDKVPDP